MKQFKAYINTITPKIIKAGNTSTKEVIRIIKEINKETEKTSYACKT